jgi:hypothetical protein
MLWFSYDSCTSSFVLFYGLDWFLQLTETNTIRVKWAMMPFFFLARLLHVNVAAELMSDCEVALKEVGFLLSISQSLH